MSTHSMTPPVEALSQERRRQLYQIAWWLALATIVYNLAEGFISTYLGMEDESFTLFGFGLDSFIECISGMGIAHLVWRSRSEATAQRDSFERTALRVTGFAFYGLAIGLSATVIWNIWSGHRPDTTIWGIVVALVSISVMWALIWQKEKTGTALRSEAILADARCARVCLWMSGILLASSAIYAYTGFPYADALGTIGLIVFSIREGKECFEKAKSDQLCTCHT